MAISHFFESMPENKDAIKTIILTAHIPDVIDRQLSVG
jgi:hypothetical protein